MYQAGDTIAGQFTIVGELGRGAFGVVYEAQQEALRRRVALKILTPHAVGQPEVMQRFAKEARLASSLVHPQAVRVYTYGEHEGLPFLAMEVLDGENLQAYLSRRGPLPESEALDLLAQTLAPLEEAHNKGIVHRDLKPENLFLCHTGSDKKVVKVLDFGIARTFGGSWEGSMARALTRHDALCGTPSYMAPEQILSEAEITPAADVYALGCIVYEMLTGNPPYTGDSALQVVRMHLDAPLPSLPPKLQGSRLARVLHRALHKDPAARFEDATTFLRVLRSLPALPAAPWETKEATPTRPVRLAWDTGARRRLSGRPVLKVDAPKDEPVHAPRPRSLLLSVAMMLLVAASSAGAMALYLAPQRTLGQAQQWLPSQAEPSLMINQDGSMQCEGIDSALCEDLLRDAAPDPKAPKPASALPPTSQRSPDNPSKNNKAKSNT